MQKGIRRNFGKRRQSGFRRKQEAFHEKGSEKISVSDKAPKKEKELRERSYEYGLQIIILWGGGQL